VAAFLKFAVNPRDEVAFKRMARLLPGIGAAQRGAALEASSAEPGKPPASIIQQSTQPTSHADGAPLSGQLRRVFHDLLTPLKCGERRPKAVEAARHMLRKSPPPARRSARGDDP